jgi:hypothetical protein
MDATDREVTMNTRSLLRTLTAPALVLAAGLLVGTPNPADAAAHFAVGHAGGFGFHGGGFRGGFRGGFGWRGGFGYGGWWGWPGYGLFLATLPLYYSTFWWDGVPYYYANDYYYVWNPGAGGYQAVSPPPQIAGRAAVTQGSNQLFAYPKNAQSAEQQARDKQECRDWAASQTGAGTAANEGDNLRAQSACLAGRGYSVR